MTTSSSDSNNKLQFDVGLPPPNRHQHASSHWKDTTTAAAAALFPQVAGLALKSALGITFALYLLNQSHLLPKPLAAVVSKVLFYPTLPITASKRIGKWVTRIDDTVIMGGAPFGFLNYPQRLKDEYGVQGVINMCELRF